MALSAFSETSRKINEFIKENAHKYDNNQALSDAIFIKFKVKMPRNRVATRCSTLGVKTKNIDHRAPKVFEFETDASPEARGLLDLLKRKRKDVWTIEDLANKLVTTPKRVREAIVELKAVGHTVDIDEGVVELQSSLQKREEP